jgi:hypothetical protein
MESCMGVYIIRYFPLVVSGPEVVGVLQLINKVPRRPVYPRAADPFPCICRI